VKLALDTNRYRDLCDNDRDVVRLLENAESIYVPFIVIAELRAGFALGTKGRENESVLQRFLMKPGVEVAYAGDATTDPMPAFIGSSGSRQLRSRRTTSGSRRSSWNEDSCSARGTNTSSICHS
jgi:hypothetical protein